MAGRAWRLTVIALAAVAALSAAGCRRTVVIRDGRMDRYTANLVRVAARDTGCAPAQLVPGQVAAEPAVYSVQGCTVPVEYWLQCGRRNCTWRRLPMLQESAAPVLQCAPQMIQAQPTQTPNVRYAVGCGRMAPFTIACNGAACQWAPSGPVQMSAPMAMPAPASPAPATAVIVPPPQAVPVGPAPVQAAPPPAALSSHVQAQREAILSCIDGGALTLRMRWTVDGQVVVQLPRELAGSAAEGCIQAVLGGLRVSAQAAGEITIPVQ